MSLPLLKERLEELNDAMKNYLDVIKEVVKKDFKPLYDTNLLHRLEQKAIAVLIPATELSYAKNNLKYGPLFHHVSKFMENFYDLSHAVHFHDEDKFARILERHLNHLKEINRHKDWWKNEIVEESQESKEDIEEMIRNLKKALYSARQHKGETIGKARKEDIIRRLEHAIKILSRRLQ